MSETLIAPGESDVETLSPVELTGRVVSAHGNLCYVDTGQGAVVCSLRGNLRRGWEDGPHQVVTGDLVLATMVGPSQGVVEQVLPRQSVLGRVREMKSDQVLAANIDQAVLVFAAASPRPNLNRVDLVLVEALSEGLPTILCINKMDLAEDWLLDQLPLYRSMPIQIVQTSTVTQEGLTRLAELLEQRTSVLWGPSGAGKSSLLNALWPGLGQRVKEVQKRTGMGTHTTVAVTMFRCTPDTWVMDTPGWRQFSPRALSREALDRVFFEVAPYARQCRFQDCRHRGEPGCGIQRAEGRVAPRRIQSYLKLVEKAR